MLLQKRLILEIKSLVFLEFVINNYAQIVHNYHYAPQGIYNLIKHKDNLQIKRTF